MKSIPLCLTAIFILCTSCKEKTMEVCVVPKEQDGSVEKSIQAPEQSSPRWQAPEHWVEKPAGNMRIATFEIGKDEQMATLTITAFPGDVGGELANLNRWLKQLQIAPITEEQIPDFAQDIQLGNYSGYQAYLKGEAGNTFAIALRVDEKTWFFKLSGSEQVIEKEQNNLLNFVKSVRF